MQAEILEKNPHADLQVYAIWFNVLPTDRRAEWDESLMTDPRVTHYWDEGQVIGTWFAQDVGFGHGPIAWDVFYLYGPAATWEDVPEPLLSSGYTLFGERAHLIEDLEPLLNK